MQAVKLVKKGEIHPLAITDYPDMLAFPPRTTAMQIVAADNITAAAWPAILDGTSPISTISRNYGSAPARRLTVLVTWAKAASTKTVIT